MNTQPTFTLPPLTQEEVKMVLEGLGYLARMRTTPFYENILTSLQAQADAYNQAQQPKASKEVAAGPLPQEA